ncbi:protein SODIUM POTASSIUM ROOT DEFECTIVE 2-like [Punica granatum]|nr:protein SODIUM POTASSIUM ROOT DEFECTIVE 2-like [Punica granatum]PKI50804.1 hypothetical protein CRG98_028799 [Punica granatum]
MGRRARSLGKILGLFLCSSSASPSCFFCMNPTEAAASHRSEDELEGRPLVESEGGRAVRLKDVLLSNDDDDQCRTLAFQLKPKTVTLRVSMHCYGCARKVEKHIAKMDGVTSYKVDLESKMVMVIGDVFPYEVLQSVSKVKNAELWISPSESTPPSPPHAHS